MFRRVLSNFFPSGANQSQQSQPGTPVDQPVTSPSSPHQYQQTQPGTPVDQPVTSPSSPHQYQQTQPGTPVDQPVTSPSSPHQFQQSQPGIPVDQPVTSPSSPYQSQQTLPSVPVDQPGTSPSSPHQSQQTQTSVPVDQPGTSPSDPHQSQQTRPSVPVDQPVTSPSSPHQSQQTQPSVPVDQPTTSPSNPHQSQQAQPSVPGVLNDIIFLSLANQIGDDWRELAIRLGFTNPEIENFQANNKKQQNQAFQMLNEWWQRWNHLDDEKGRGAKNALCVALRATGRYDLVLFVKGAAQFNPDPYRDEFIRYYQDEMSVVPLLPCFSTDNSRINDIYVELELQERQNRAGTVVQRAINSHADMFKLTFEDKTPVRFILLSGIAGSGKTTIVSKIATDWAKQKPGSPLSKFTFLVALSMRKLKGEPDLTEAICDQILAQDTKLGRKSLKRYLSSHAEEVLVVLDGADEFDKEGSQLPSEGNILSIISNNFLRGCTVVVTTRPHMVEKLYKLNQSFFRIDISGFSDEGAKAYVRKFFKHVDPNVSARFWGYYERYQTLLQLARIPIMLLSMCLAWPSDGNKPPETLTDLFKEAFLFMLKSHLEKYGLPIPEDEELLKKNLKDLVNALGDKALDGVISPFEFKRNDFENSTLLDEAFKSGILSREKIRRGTHTFERVTFFHKIFQEAIAGFYWASLAESDETVFTSYLSKVDRNNALSMKDLLRFCYEGNVKAAESLLSHVAAISSRETPVQ